MTPSQRRDADALCSADEISARLGAELPRWTFDSGSLCRRVRTGGWKATLMVVNTVGHLAEAAWHHPDLAVSYDVVDIRLVTHAAGGVTTKDFELARKIEEVLMWQPAREPGAALEGTPADPRHAYIRYE
jgi:4a-hydroxytetrahydrobiopterin dehydratase